VGWSSGCPLDARLLLPDRKGLGACRPILGGRHLVAARPEVLVEGAMGGEKALGLPGRLEALHVALPLSCGPVRVLGAVVEIPALAMLDPGQDLLLGGAVTLELIGHDDARDIPQALQQFPEEALLGIPAALDQNIQDVAVLVDGAPEIVLPALDPDEIHVPLVARTPPAQPVREVLPEAIAPLPDRLVRDFHTALGQDQFDLAQAQAEAVVEPDRLVDDIGRVRKPR
jgi:hypothetical protein